MNQPFRQFVFCVMAVAVLGTGCKKSLNVSSGAEGGTYYAIAESLKSIKDFAFKNTASAGSKANIESILAGKSELAIVQLDVLDNMMYNNKSIEQKVRILVPIYKEEVHLLVSSSVKGVSGLNGKNVSIGPKGSGTEGTAQLLLGYLGLSSGQVTQVNNSAKKALKQLLSGKIAGMFLVAGAPTKTLASVKGGDATKIKLLPLASGATEKIRKQVSQYKKTKIKAKTYKWLDKSVETLAVHSVLISTAELSHDSARALVQAIIDNKSSLAQAHEKWKEFDLKSGGGFSGQTLSIVHKAAIDLIQF